MKRFHRNVGAMQPAFYQRPEVLQSVGVNAAIYVLNCVVNYLMLVLVGQSRVSAVCVSVERRSSFDVLLNHWLQAGLVAISHDLSTNLSTTLNESHDGTFIVLNTSTDAALLYILVHVSRFPADVSFVYFNFASAAAKFASKEIVLHGETDAMQHEPCRLLSYL